MARQISVVATRAGATATSTGVEFAGYDRKTKDLLFGYGVIGYSVTRYSPATGAPSWAVEVYGRLHNLTAGPSFLIGGVTGVGSTTSGLIPLRDMNGTTQHTFLGIPKPMTVNFVGSSNGVGDTFGAVVIAHLWAGS